VLIDALACCVCSIRIKAKRRNDAKKMRDFSSLPLLSIVWRNIRKNSFFPDTDGGVEVSLSVAWQRREGRRRKWGEEERENQHSIRYRAGVRTDQ